MALITCSECSARVSDKAAACPKCGNPIASAGVSSPTGASVPGDAAPADNPDIAKATAPPPRLLEDQVHAHPSPPNVSDHRGGEIARNEHFGAPGAAAPGHRTSPHARTSTVKVGLFVILVVMGVVIASLVIQSNQEQERATAARQQQIAEEKRQEDISRAAAQAVENARQEAARQVASEKNALRASPESYLEASHFVFYDKGIVNSYRTLTSVQITNKSHFGVRDLSGDVEWSDDQGGRLGSTPFTIRGKITAGDTRRFETGNGSLTSGTIEGEGERVSLKFTNVTIID